MIIKQAKLWISAVGPDQYPIEGKPEFALSGRSNVGKSSLINRFLNRKGLARTSSTPGKTQTLNFYEINESWFFVDLPGYGYAKTSKTERARWGRFIENYLNDRKELAGVIQLVDIRHDAMESDRDMIEWLQHYNVPMLVVATKGDKIARGHWAKHLKKLRQGLALQEETPLLAFSAQTGQGRDELVQWIEGKIEFYSTIGPIDENIEEEDGFMLI